MILDPETREHPEEEPARAAGSRPWLYRALYLLVLVSFFLPFATVRGCSGEEKGTYTGIDLLRKEVGGVLSLVLMLAFILLAFSFARRPRTALGRGTGRAVGALLSALAFLAVIVGTGVTFLFDTVREQVGLVLCAGAWMLLYLLGLASSAREYVVARRACSGKPPPWGPILGLLLGGFMALSAFLSEPANPGELFGGLGAGVLVFAPIVLLGMLAAVAYRGARRREGIAPEGEEDGGGARG